MRSIILGLAAALSLGACQTQPMSASSADPYKAAIADPGRPAADAARDAARKPAEMLAFAGVRRGETIGEILPGGGYFTRIFSKAVGPTGHVYAIVPPAGGGDGPKPDPTKPTAIQIIAADYKNVTILTQDFAAIAPPRKFDLVWTSQNYHDLHLARFHADLGKINKAVYDSLKPGGLYIVLDHAAAPGTGLDIPDKLHRINPEIVKSEVTGAGFVFVGESDVLRNPADDHSKIVFDPSIRGHTDQFIYKFKKPG